MKFNSSFRAAEILTLSFAHFVHDIYSSFLSPLLPLLIQKLSLSLAQAGSLAAILQVPALLNPLIGMVADRMSLRIFVILAPTLTAIPMSLIGMAPSYGILVLLLLMAGISVALFHVPAPVIIARMAGDRTGTGMSFFMTGGELARAVGPVIAVGAVSLMGLQGFWPIMAVGIAASCMLHVRLRKVNIGCYQDKTHVSLAATARNMKHLLIPMALILVARSFMQASMTAFLPTFINEQSGSLWLGGIGLAMFEAAGVAGVLTSGWLSDRIGRRRMLVISLAAAPPGVLAFVTGAAADTASTFSHIQATLALLLTGFMLLSTTPVMLAMVQEHAEKSPAAANGIYMMTAFLVRSSVVVAIGFIGDHFGLESTYYLGAALGILAVPLAWKLPGRKKKYASNPNP